MWYNLVQAIISGWGNWQLRRGDSDPVLPDDLHNALQKAEVTIYPNSVGEDAYGDNWPKGSFPAGDTNVSVCAVCICVYNFCPILTNFCPILSNYVQLC